MPAGNDQNPYRSPGQLELPTAETVELQGANAKLEVLDELNKNASWILLLHDDHLRCVGPGQVEISVQRHEMPLVATLHDSLLIKPSLEVRSGGRHLFQFSREDFNLFKTWLGPTTKLDLKMALKRRFAYVLPFAVLFVVISLPMSGNVAAGVEPLPFDPILCSLGVSLAVMATAARLFPHRFFFLLDSLWFAALAGMLLYDIGQGASWTWLIMVAIHLHIISLGIRQFLRFGEMLPESNVVKEDASKDFNTSID